MSLDEAELNGCWREMLELRRRGWGMLGRPQASVARGRVVCRLETEIWVCVPGQKCEGVGGQKGWHFEGMY